MEIKFQTKEESNRLQQEEFLKLSGAERFQSFLNLSRRINQLFPSKEINTINPNNFVINPKLNNDKNSGSENR
jgi:hypothetical protein